MKITTIAIILAVAGLIQGCKYEVAQWRGTERNGTFQESGLLEQWPEEGPELLWTYEGVGRGYAAPAVLGGKLFVNGEQEGKSYLLALDLDGDLLWKSPNGEEFLGDGFSSTYPGARSTPTVMGKLVYASSGTGRIGCFNSSTGAEEWALSITDDLGGEMAYFGYSESVAADGDHVYCFPGGAETNFAAINRFSGEVVWSCEALRDTFAYGSPVLVDLPERDILITTSRHNIFTLDRSNGELLGSYGLEEYEYDGEHCNSVIYEDGHIYFVANDVGGQGALKLELSEDGKTITEVWRNPDILNNFGGFLVLNGHLFTTVKGNKLLGLEPEGGNVSDSLKVATGSLVYADNKIICYGNNGTVNLVSYSGDQMEITGQLKIKEGTGHHFSHPVLAEGVMYIRRGNAIMAYKVI
ncbi:MAG: PQQ-like beta-propeller repeat protein [Bacteroidetes bacterium]|nr:PQQ-like beta-propeller repeat protein [Bacteroidota bacterium]